MPRIRRSKTNTTYFMDVFVNGKPNPLLHPEKINLSEEQENATKHKYGKKYIKHAGKRKDAAFC